HGESPVLWMNRSFPEVCDRGKQYWVRTSIRILLTPVKKLFLSPADVLDPFGDLKLLGVHPDSRQEPSPASNTGRRDIAPPAGVPSETLSRSSPRPPSLVDASPPIACRLVD